MEENNNDAIIQEEFQLLKMLKDEKNNINGILNSFKNIEKYRQKPDYYLKNIKNELAKIKSKIDSSSLLEPLKTTILEKYDEISSHLPEWEDLVKKYFGREFEKVLNEKGLQLLGNDYMNLQVLLYTIEVDLDSLKAIIWFGKKQEKVATLNLNPELVTKKILTAYQKMTANLYSDEEFLDKLYAAYKTVLLKNGLKEGKKVRISDVHKEFVFLIQGRNFMLNPVKSNFKGFSRIQFTYNLYRLKTRTLGSKELTLVTANQTATRSRVNFMWVPTNEQGNGTVISHILFREKE